MKSSPSTTTAKLHSIITSRSPTIPTSSGSGDYDHSGYGNEENENGDCRNLPSLREIRGNRDCIHEYLEMVLASMI